MARSTRVAEIFTSGGAFVVLGTHEKRVREHNRMIHDSSKLMQIQPGKNHDQSRDSGLLFVEGRTGSPVAVDNKEAAF